MRRVIVESPYKGNVRLNVAYARAALRDCISRGESPYASHLLYTQRGVLNDAVEAERKLGIRAGFEWRRAAHATVIYTDLGVTEGMELGVESALEYGHAVEYRTIEGWSEPEQRAREFSVEDLEEFLEDAEDRLRRALERWGKLKAKVEDTMRSVLERYEERLDQIRENVTENVSELKSIDSQAHQEATNQMLINVDEARRSYAIYDALRSVSIWMKGYL